MNPVLVVHAAALLAAVLAVLLVAPVRRALLTGPLFALFKKILPAMSQTEKEALEAGTVWWDGDLFSGKPDWNKLLAYPAPELSAEEQSFLDRECEELCRITSEWESTQVHQDLSPESWRYIKEKGFLGMIIPKRYGGLGFSAFAHSQVVQKLSTHSSAAVVSVMVPNSLGPAELILHYGTEEQKDYYLPRLAKGLEIPAFALTSPWAGSDAASMPDVGIVCKGLHQGREVLGMRVSWNKRYITLSPICTVLGLAFRLLDPDHLLGTQEDIGITCALVPSRHPGVVTNRRHAPLNAVWQNGPTSGKDVFMPLSWIVGGAAMAGQGWRMLMECLAAGRSISLPGSNTGMAKLAVRGTGGYARVRSQFKTPIGKFEGIEEPLARMGGNLYLMDAARTMTAGAVDAGEKPSVVSAIVKYHITERARKVVNDAMDVQGGKGICMGPNNFLARAYQQLPVAITVEGANILTRCLIIFGQGAIRCHPYVLKELRAAQEQDHDKAVRDFDSALIGHIGFTLGNAVRALFTGLTASRFVAAPSKASAQTKRYYQQLTHFSASFALLSDVSMTVMGGDLKRREKISARLGDILSLMYLCSATLKRFEDEGQQAADVPLMHWAMQDALFAMQNAFDGVLVNYPNRMVAALLRTVVFPLGKSLAQPDDRQGHEVAKLLIDNSPTRERLTAGMYLPRDENDAIGVIELALESTLAAEGVEARIRAAKKVGLIHGTDAKKLAIQAQQAAVITMAELAQLKERDRLRDKVIHVDDFPADFGVGEAHATQALRRAA